MRKFLHVGCGSDTQKNAYGFHSPAHWQEVRLDINPLVNPDVIGTITDMRGVESDSMDAVYSAHNIEHVYPHEVPIALSEFHRVLKPDGFLVVTCPDLDFICAAVREIGLHGTLYVSPAGPIRPLDVIYGHQPSVAAGNTFMAHKGGFTQKTLHEALGEANFMASVCARTQWALYALATKGPCQQQDLQALAQNFFPS